MKRKIKLVKDKSERYLVSYADMLTLMLCFFIILYSMSDPNPEKHQQLGDIFESVFKPRTEQVEIFEENDNRTYGQALTPEEEVMMKSIAEQNNLRKIKRKIDNEIRQRGLENEVSTLLYEDGLKIILVNDILFDSGSARLKNTKNLEIINYISEMLEGFANNVSILGHTDNVPINNKEYKSNWELSSARSLSVLQYMLNNNKNLDPTRFSAVGLGEYYPIDTNMTEDGREKNRRVEIVIERQNYEGLLKPNGN